MHTALGTRRLKTFLLLQITALCVSSSMAFAADPMAGASMQEIVSGVQKLCGGSGSGVDLQISGDAAATASKAVSILVNGKISGSATFSRSEWDGVRAVRDDAKSYTECVKSLTPVFIDKFAQKKAETPTYNITIRSSSRFINNYKFGPVDGSISNIELKIDGKRIIMSDLDKPFGSRTVSLRGGEHTFEFIASIYGSGNYGAILKDNCQGSFTVSESLTLQPRIKIERRDLDGAITDCSLDPL